MALRNRGGKWHYRFKVRGKVYSGPTDLGATERKRSDALLIEAEARKLVLGGKAHLLKLETKFFHDAANEFLSWARGEHRDKLATVRRLETSFASLREFFGTRAIDTICAGDIEKYKTWRRNDHKIKEVTLRHDLHALSPFFNFAIRNNWRHDNPVKAVSIPSDKDAVRMHPLSDLEERAYFEAARRYPNLWDLGRLMLNQGVRPEEGMRCRCENVDVYAGELHITEGKSKASRRTLYLTPESNAILARRKGNRTHGWIFEGKIRGTPLTKVNGSHEKILDGLNPCQSCGQAESIHEKHPESCPGYRPPISDIRFVLYDLRHTFATRMIAAGVDIMTLKDIMGHEDIRVTQKYIHPTKDRQRTAMAVYAASLRVDQKCTKSEKVGE